jgi:hypothetical protein
MAGCGLDSGSLIAFATVLNNNDTITSIDFSDNRSCFSTLSQTLQHDTIKHLSCMVEVSFRSHNRIQQNYTLLEMGMSKLGITDWTSVDLLAPALKIASTIRILDLSCNKIGRDGGVAIFKALHQNQSIKSLKLGCCQILDEGAEAAGEMLVKNQVLQKLYLEYNGITGTGLEAIARGVLQNSSLLTLGLWGNEWDVGACQAFAPLIGGSIRQNDVGEREDVLPDGLCAVKLKNLHGTWNNVMRIDANAQQFNQTAKPRVAGLATRLKSHDFVIYSVEKVLSVAKKDF